MISYYSALGFGSGFRDSDGVDMRGEARGELGGGEVEMLKSIECLEAGQLESTLPSLYPTLWPVFNALMIFSLLAHVLMLRKSLRTMYLSFCCCSASSASLEVFRSKARKSAKPSTGQRCCTICSRIKEYMRFCVLQIYVEAGIWAFD